MRIKGVKIQRVATYQRSHPSDHWLSGDKQMANDANITQEYLKSILDYDLETGIFRWKVSNNNRIKIGSIAGTVNDLGYLKIGIDKKPYKLHRLAWLYVYGCSANGDVDHINLNKLDNRISNLRIATRSQNLANTSSKKKYGIRLKGVRYRDPNKKYLAEITYDGKTRYLGYYDCPAAASFAYQIAADKHHGEYARYI